MSAAFAPAVTAILPDELAWATECAEAGDTLQDIAEGSGRSVEEWSEVLIAAGVVCRKAPETCELAERDRMLIELYLDGVPFSKIGPQIGVTGWWANCLAEGLIQRGILARRGHVVGHLPPETRLRISELQRERGRAGEAQYFAERNAEIVVAVEEGRTYTQVARKFGVSREAVGGVVHRDRRRRQLARAATA